MLASPPFAHPCANPGSRPVRSSIEASLPHAARASWLWRHPGSFRTGHHLRVARRGRDQGSLTLTAALFLLAMPALVEFLLERVMQLPFAQFPPLLLVRTHAARRVQQSRRGGLVCELPTGVVSSTCSPSATRAGRDECGHVSVDRSARLKNEPAHGTSSCRVRLVDSPERRNSSPTQLRTQSPSVLGRCSMSVLAFMQNVGVVDDHVPGCQATDYPATARSREIADRRAASGAHRCAPLAPARSAQ